MKLSIITPTLNQSQFIEDTIISVQNQNFKNIEHIVIDGGSTDGTIDILKKYKHLKWISEKDSGQSNAINKGFRMATGDIVAWINSDDYYDTNVFNSVSDFFCSHKDCHFLYGDINYIEENGKLIASYKGDNLTLDNLIRCPDIVRQPSCFWTKDVISDIGYLNERLHLVMDFEFFLRIGMKYRYYYLGQTFSNFRFYQTNKTNRLLKKQAVELFTVLFRYRKLNISNCKLIFKRYLKSLIDNWRLQ